MLKYWSPQFSILYSFRESETPQVRMVSEVVLSSLQYHQQNRSPRYLIGAVRLVAAKLVEFRFRVGIVHALARNDRVTVAGAVVVLIFSEDVDGDAGGLVVGLAPALVDLERDNEITALVALGE